jgi:hypothetical protein
MLETPYVARDWRSLSYYADRLDCSVRHLQRQVKAGRLKAALIDGRDTCRTCDQFIDEWLLSTVTSKERP